MHVHMSMPARGAPACAGVGLHMKHVPARLGPAHTQHTRGHTLITAMHTCACVHPHLMPAAVCPGALGVFAPSCVLVCTCVLSLAHIMADAQALFPLPCCCCGD